uniref:Trichome birefringence-like C-terminal domain-containing protein n=1 Tax=Chenopodium quinoa TaxID=63459 RepID=A0A803LVZ0_CHEQI
MKSNFISSILLLLLVANVVILVTNACDEELSSAVQHRNRKPKRRGRRNGCNIFKGSWVYDRSYPLYDTNSCPFIGDGFNCQKNGRPDKDYLKYRWQPYGCNLQRWEYFMVGGKIIKNIDHMKAYNIALRTWAKWVDDNIDSRKTQVFFQGVSAAHINGSEWGEPRAKFCRKETRPVLGSVYPGGSHPGEVIVRKVLSRMKKPVHLLDITLLTQLRKDGHPAIYAGGGPKLLDCSHWCLPGVPDTWNQLLYSILFRQ